MSPGPLPKHPSIRTRRGSVALTQLPAGGRPGKPPPWPLPPDASLNGQHLVALAAVQRCESDITAETDGRRRRRLTRNLDAARDRAAVLKVTIGQSSAAERALWRDLWATSQAVLWESSHSHRAVALYGRLMIKGELGNLDAAKEARQWSDRLGLNPLALLRLRAEVERVDEVENRGRQRRRPNSTNDAASDPRLMLVESHATDGGAQSSGTSIVPSSARRSRVASAMKAVTT